MLYKAAKAAGLRKIILISAVGKADTPFAGHRRDSEAVAKASGLPTIILRPSMVLGETSFGSSSLLRALAALRLCWAFLPPERFLDGLSGVPLSGQALTIAARAAGLIDLAIVFGLLAAWRLPRLALMQLGMVGRYTIAFGLMAPMLWLDPYSGLLKNIPILCLIIVHFTLEGAC